MTKEVIVMYSDNWGNPYFIATHNEEMLMRRFRELSEADRKEIEMRVIELAVRYVEQKK